MKLIFFALFVSAVNSIPHRSHSASLKKIPISPRDEGDSYRLPTTSAPISYNIDLITHIHENGENKFDFEGSVSIVTHVISETKTIVLHSRLLDILSLEVKDLNNIDFATTFDPEPNERDFLTITSTLGSFITNTSYTIKITFNGTLRNDNLGFYRSSYERDGKTVWLATTQFQNVEARTAFPCYDEPGIRATYKISIQHGSEYFAISNMDTEGLPTSIEDGVAKTQFLATPPVQTYLLAFIISDFKHVSSNSYANIPQRVYAKPQSVDAGEADVALRYGQAILDKFEENFKLKYILPKMDQIALPDFDAGAMENWGLVTYREEYLLYNKLTSRTRQRDNVMTVISHEFAHQYFGDLVSPVWWSFLWMNEGFATLYEWYLVSLLYPDDRLMDSFVLDAVHVALAYDGNDVRAMTTNVETPSEIDDLFDDIAYEKSGSVLRMVMNFLGERLWERGMNYYLTDMALKSANSQDLYRGIQKAIDEDGTSFLDIAKVMGSWENQSGYPVVTVRWNKDELILSQERFLYKSPIIPDTTLWHIPINYVLGTNPDFSSTKADFFMNKEASVTLTREKAPKKWRNVDWVVLNAQQGYYYRVNYDDDMWKSLTSQLYSDHTKIHVLNRAQLLDDSFQLARAKIVSYDIPLSVIKYLKNEIDYVPWESGYNGIIQFKNWLEGTSAFEKYKIFIQNLVSPLFNQSGMEVIEFEHKFDRYVRSLGIQLACQFEVQACLDEASEKLQNVLKGIEISPDLQEAIYQNALRTANETIYDGMIEKLLSTEDQGQRTIMIAALGCSADLILQKKLLSLAIDPNSTLRRQERLRTFNAWTNGGAAGIAGAIEFVAENHAKIEEIQEGRAHSMIRGIASRISSVAMRDKFSEMLTTLNTLGVVSNDDKNKHLASAMEIITWQNDNADSIESWLETNDAAYRWLPSIGVMMMLIFARIFL